MPSFRRVNPGDRVRGTLSAGLHNALVDQINNPPASRGAMPAEFLRATPAEFYLSNQTGGLVDQFGVLRPGAPVSPPSDADESEWRNKRVYAGTMPDEGAPFAIVQEALASGSIGRAVIIGVTPALIEMADESHTYAAPREDSNSLLSQCEAGPARILWVESSGSSGGAARRAVVLLTGAGGMNCDSSGGSGGGYIDVVVSVCPLTSDSSGGSGGSGGTEEPPDPPDPPGPPGPP